MRSLQRQLTLVALGLAVAGATVGCAQERDPINRVQPQALKKSWFVGDLKNPNDDPEFYARAMVIDAGYGVSQDLVFTNTINVVGRIKWSIEEDMLIGRSSMERIPGSDAKGNRGGKDNDGVVAYAYRIQSHFDVRRDYNPATGEETNVVGENAVDRPWYEREYMRVDWSRNLNAKSYDFDTVGWLTGVTGVQYESLGWSDTDQARYPDSKPQFETIEQDGYFDVTNRVLVTPGTIDLPAAWGGGRYPACFISDVLAGGTAPVGMCNPAEMVVRQSFLRVDPKKHDYEPMSWDGHKFEIAGAFTTERNGFARNYGITDDRQTWLINRYNIWKNAHYYSDAATMSGAVACNTDATTPFGSNPNRDDDADGTEDECKAVTVATGVGGSRCDLISKKCTLPFRKRAAKPLAWYDSNDSDPRYAQGSAWATHEWDVALRMAVNSARYAECMATDKQSCEEQFPVVRGQLAEAEDLTFLTREIDACRQGETERKDCDALADDLADTRGYSAAVKALAKVPEMVVFCHKAKTSEELATWNAKWSMKATDKNYWVESVCGDIKKMNPRAGDMRYNLITSVMTPQTPSPWGIMTDAHDPLTGEVISTSANVWTYINDLWSQGAVDQLRYMYGELSTQDVTDGKYIEEWSTAAAQASRGGAVMPTFSRDQVDARLASAANVSVEEFRSRAARFANDSRLQALKQQVKDQVAQVAAGEGAVSVNSQVVKARKERLLGTSVEAALSTPAMQSVFDKDTRSALGQMPTASMSSPLRGLDPAAIREMRRAWQAALADRGVCYMNEMPSPMGYIGLGNILQDKFGKFDKTQPKQAQYDRAEKMRSYIGQTAHYAVMTHEMGHSIGLRHNFVSSSDSWNYRPQYWQLRTNNKAVTAECTTATADGRTCVGPRYFDPVTDNEAKNLVQMWMHSSTMEYAGEPTQDFLGLGAYDYHAAELFYADSVHVYTDAGYRRTAAGGRAALAKMDQFGGLIGFDYQNVNHYSALDKTYNMIRDCAAVADINAFKPVNWNEGLYGKWNPVLDGHIVTDESGKYTRCKQQLVDHVQYRVMKDNPSASFSQNKRTAYDAQNRVRVPYGFATDNWADLGNVAVYRHDNGGDFYEQIAFWITQMETGHIFDNYRRNRAAFSIRGSYGRALGRYFEKMRDGGKGMGLFYNIYRMILGDQGVDFDGAWPSFLTGLEANVMASGMAFDTFTRLFQRPQAGTHAMVTNFNGKVLRSMEDSSYDNGIGAPGEPVVVETNQLTIPNGATGMQDATNPNFRSVSWGGRPLNNALADGYDKGDYSSQFTTGVGSYYEKSFVPLMLTESEDNFISSSRRDFFDPRWRNISMADIFPDGFRRFVAHNLADDDTLRGVRVAADANGKPLRGTTGFPTNGLSFTQWWPSAGPSACFPGANSYVCSRDQVLAGSSLQPADFGALTFNNVAIVEPQVAIEQQKFLIVHTLLNLPVNSMPKWMDQMRVFAAPYDDPSAIPAASRMEFHNPNGLTYFAKSHGKENVFGKTVHRGIAARVLEHANELLNKAYVTAKVTNGSNTWYVPVIGSNGRPLVKFQGLAETVTGCRAVASTNAAFDPNANFGTAGAASLAEYEAAYAGCAVSSNQAAIALEKYITVPDFLRTVIEMTYGAELRGVY